MLPEPGLWHVRRVDPWSHSTLPGRIVQQRFCCHERRGWAIELCRFRRARRVEVQEKNSAVGPAKFCLEPVKEPFCARGARESVAFWNPRRHDLDSAQHLGKAIGIYDSE